MKRLIALVLALCLCLSLFACGGKKTDDTTAGGDETAGGSATTGTESIVDTENFQANADENEIPGENEPVYGGTLRIVNTSEGSYDLGLPWEIMNADTNCITACLESLIYQKTDGSIEPCLAESWEVNQEEASVTFKLREGVTFHDGSPFNAESAAWNIEQFLGSGRMNTGDHVEILDEYTIKLVYKKWQYTALTSMYSANFSFVSMKQYQEMGEEYARKNPCGTGPFKFGEYNRGSSVKWVRNDNYWVEGQPYLDAIEFIFMTDATTKTNAIKLPFAEGGIDILNLTDAYQISELAKLDSVYINYVAIGPTSLYPDSNDPNSPLSDVRVRKAVSYALDRDAICAARGYGVYQPGIELVDPAWGCFLEDPEYQCTYDPDMARQLLTEAGYPDGFTIDFHVQPNLFDKDVAVIVQQMLAEVGITANVNYPESGGYTDLKSNGWSGMLGQMWRNLTDIVSSFVLFFDASLNEETGEYYHQWMPSAYRPYEELYIAENAAYGAPEPDDELLGEVLKIFMGEMLAIPVYYCYDAFVIKNEVHDSGYGDYAMVFQPARCWKEA